MNNPTSIKILHHCHIYTQDTTLPVASMLVVQGNRISAVEPDDSRRFLYRDFPHAQIEEIDLGGRTILPGFCDSHIHLEYYSRALQKVNCETNSLQECLQRIQEQSDKVSPGNWIVGHGWNQNQWDSGYGNAQQLDAIAPHHPVYLTAKSLHAAWVNSRALELAGIQDDTPDPPNGTIQRDQSGKPTGILFESAMQLVEALIPPPDITELAQALLSAQAVLNKMGITSVHDFDSLRCFSSLQILEQQGLLKLRVLKGIPANAIETAIAMGLRSGFGNSRLRLGSIKLFADGALGPRTAAMFQPYEGEEQNDGVLFIDGEELVEKTLKAIQSGFSLAIHAIGDRAVHEMLNGYEKIRVLETENKAHRTPLRHRIEHVQLIHPDDIARLAQLQIIASMQPIHATSDMEMADRYWGKRAQFAYAWRSLWNNHTPIIFGSDAPVESPNPFWGLHAAITRQSIINPTGKSWYPQQRLTLEEAIQAYTLNPAYAAGMEHQLGKLSPGFLADLIILDEDPYSLSSNDIPHIQPAATMIGGEWVWRNF